MKLEFQDGSQIDVITIFGGPRLVDGVSRDTLRIEMDPSIDTVENLEEIFKDSSKTNTLYTIITGERGDMKSKIGEGYNIFVSIAHEMKTISPVAGSLEPPRKEEICVVKIAQETYSEHQLRSLQEGG